MMNSRIALRIALGLALFISTMYGWLAAATIIILIGLWLFPQYAECVIAGIAYDALFGMSTGMGVRGYEGTLVTAVMFALTLFLKKFLRR